MDYRDYIKKAVDYIEENLYSEINIDACAKAAGYSKYHFLRVFAECVKLTPADYIRKRRITEVVKKLYNNPTNISEIAFEYGFNSKENFTRAFKKEHHVLPSEYKTALSSLKLYEPFKFKTEKICIEPQIVTLEKFNVIAYKSDEDYTPNFWNKYNSRKFSKKLSGGVVCKDYGVNIWNEKDKKVDYFIGIREKEAKGNTYGTIRINISGGLYAVFATPVTTHYNFVSTIHKTWEYINCVWFRNEGSGYRRAGGYEFETYIEQSRIFSEKIYIPITKK